jgi:hypothetical protein
MNYTPFTKNEIISGTINTTVGVPVTILTAPYNCLAVIDSGLAWQQNGNPWTITNVVGFSSLFRTSSLGGFTNGASFGQYGLVNNANLVYLKAGTPVQVTDGDGSWNINITLNLRVFRVD